MNSNDWLRKGLDSAVDVESNFRKASFRCVLNELAFTQENFETLKEMLIESYSHSINLQKLLQEAIKEIIRKG